MSKPLPVKYSYLNDTTMPRIVKEAVKLYGTLEAKGSVNNSVIVGWADEVEAGVGTSYSKWAADWYNSDSIAWCGLAAAICAVRANPDRLRDRMPPTKYLSALEWQHFGVGVNLANVAVGDIAVKSREGGGHVTIIVGVTKDCNGKIIILHCLGGNQGDAFKIDEYSASVFSYFRRTPYNNLPAGARQIEVGFNNLATTGVKES